jgi:hypothetical protein
MDSEEFGRNFSLSHEPPTKLMVAQLKHHGKPKTGGLCKVFQLACACETFQMTDIQTSANGEVTALQLRRNQDRPPARSRGVSG